MNITLNEFRAWFDGYCEGINSLPSINQWEKIKQKLNEVRETIPDHNITYAPTFSPGLLPWPGTTITCESTTPSLHGKGNAIPGSVTCSGTSGAMGIINGYAS